MGESADNSQADQSDHLDIPQNHRDDEWTREIIRRVVAAGTVAVDVGANVGDVTAALVEAAPESQHIAIEPIPELAALVRERFPSVVVHEAALAAEAGPDVEFVHVVSNPSYSGLRERRYDRPNEELQRIRVRTTTLDSIVPEDAHVSFVKIDVEGGELGVLRGASRVLDQRPVVVFEHGLGAADHYGTEPATVFEIFDGKGLKVSGLDRYLDGKPHYSKAEFEDEFYSGRRWNFVAHP